MLTKVFQSVAFPYLEGTSGGDAHNIAPWRQSTNAILGLYVIPTADPTEAVADPTVTSAGTVVSLNQIGLCVTFYDSSTLTKTSASLFFFDSDSGVILSRTDANTGAFFGEQIFESGQGNGYFNQPDVISRGALLPIDLTSIATTGSASYLASTFGLTQFSSTVQLDEVAQVLLNDGGYNQLQIFALNTGVLQYTLYMPDNIISICLVDGTRCYVLCENSTLVLVDTSSGSVLSVAYLPPSAGTDWSGISVTLYWWAAKGQLLVCQTMANNVDGSNATVVLGYKMVPSATRLTPPLPLQAPKVGNTVQVMTQLLDDMNVGVGGAVVYPTVTGPGQQAGFTLTDQYGRSFTKVLCTATGSVAIDCTATVPDVM